MRPRLLLLILAFSGSAFADSICGVDVPRAWVYAERYPLVWKIDEGSSIDGFPKSCRQDDKLFIVIKQFGKLLAFYRENSIVQPEALLGQTLSETLRRTYIQQMSERAAFVVETALKSGLVTDKGIANYLRSELAVLKKEMPIDPTPPDKNPSCQREHTIALGLKKNRSAAYVRQADPKTNIYFCEYVYKLDSPYLFMHELVHWLRRGYLKDKAEEECIADLVTKTALSAAIKTDATIPTAWNSRGSYFERCNKKFKERFQKMNLPDSENISVVY